MFLFLPRMNLGGFDLLKNGDKSTLEIMGQAGVFMAPRFSSCVLFLNLNDLPRGISAFASAQTFDAPWLQLALLGGAAAAHVFPQEKYSLTSTKMLLYLFGGLHDSNTTAELFTFNLTSREGLQCREMEPCRSPAPTEVDTSPAVAHSQWPSTCHSHMSATSKGRVVVLGGVGPFGERLGDVHTDDEETSTWWRVSLKAGNSLTSAAFKLPLHPGVATVKDENGAAVLVLVWGLNPGGQCLSTILIIDTILGTLRQISSNIPPVQQLRAASMANTGVISSMLPEAVVLTWGQVHPGIPWCPMPRTLCKQGRPALERGKTPPPAQCSHASGGEQPPGFIVLGMCGTRAPAWEGRQGAEAAPVNRGPTAPLQPAKSTFPRWPGTSDADSFLPNAPNQCVHPEVPTTTLTQPPWQTPPAPLHEGTLALRARARQSFPLFSPSSPAPSSV